MILFSGIDIVILKNDIDAEEEADILSRGDEGFGS